jgi:2-oxoglutarate dehydrogenase E1 component
MEQFYPFPESQLRDIINRHQGSDLVWVQDEPENQGAWPFIALELRRLGIDNVRVVSRPASASPAAGSSKRSADEHAAIMDDAFHGL